MTLPAPKLHPIDEEMVLFGKIHLEWTDVGAPNYFIYRDYEPVKNICGWQPYQVVESGKTNYDDSFFENQRTYYYAIVAASEDGLEKSPPSNTESVKVELPPNLVVDKHQLEEAAYYESRELTDYDEKIKQLARYKLIFEKTFPDRDLNYLETRVKSLKRDLPEFTGMFKVPTESEIIDRAADIVQNRPSKMELDWDLSEHKLIKKKIEDLIEYEAECR